MCSHLSVTHSTSLLHTDKNSPVSDSFAVQRSLYRHLSKVSSPHFSFYSDPLCRVFVTETRSCCIKTATLFSSTCRSCNCFFEPFFLRISLHADPDAILPEEERTQHQQAEGNSLTSRSLIGQLSPLRKKRKRRRKKRRKTFHKVGPLHFVSSAKCAANRRSAESKGKGKKGKKGLKVVPRRSTDSLLARLFANIDARSREFFAREC